MARVSVEELHVDETEDSVETGEEDNAEVPELLGEVAEEGELLEVEVERETGAQDEKQRSMQPGSLLGLAGLAMWGQVQANPDTTEIVVGVSQEEGCEEVEVVDAGVMVEEEVVVEETERFHRLPLPPGQKRMLEVAKLKAPERRKAARREDWPPTLLPAGLQPPSVNEDPGHVCQDCEAGRVHVCVENREGQDQERYGGESPLRMELQDVLNDAARLASE